jgi:predicted RNA-binding Zn ribbon-like protein
MVSSNSATPEFSANRLCLDFANLPFASGDQTERPIFWDEFVDFLAAKQIVSHEKSSHIRAWVKTDPRAAENLLGHAERLGRGLRLSIRAIVKGQRIHDEWTEPINRILRVTEGHDELQRDGTAWRLGFVAREEGLEWLLAAVARSGAELIAEGVRQNLKQCANPYCQILFYDDSKTHRRRWCSMALCGNRSKVAAFALRNRPDGETKTRAHHA